MTTPLPEDRHLAQFTNADGHAPDGRDDRHDDSIAMAKALAAGPGIVRIGPGHYRMSDIAIPSGVSVIGAGPSTVIHPSNTTAIFHQRDAHDWVVRDLVLDGDAAGDWADRTDTGAAGFCIEHCWGYEIRNVTIRNINGAGIRIAHTDLQAAGWSRGGYLDRVTAIGNHTGIHFDIRAEYVTATALCCLNNSIGCFINAGNVKVTASNFGHNTDGIVISDKENGSHGIIADCLSNHNSRYALWAHGVQNGMNITGCCFFYGTILLQSSTGVNISNGSMSCNLQTVGPGVNRIAGNFVIPLDFSVALAPSTLCDGNFTESGPWPPSP